MNSVILSALCILLCLPFILTTSISQQGDEAVVHFGFQLENGQTRDENIKYNMKATAADKEEDVEKSAAAAAAEKPVEYRGGFSFISDDGYEYTTLYKANKNGFQPYVTARKIQKIKTEEKNPKAAKE